ncbi:zonular occludens toxin domain-containing protein [Methylobacter sp.]|uniref:zonular occludens toxin family protein n=1 Tax=Methylobacter sp. TaxID=2051955 RepID=UPI002488F3BF|nr:zonular occludens toxin domain-containing protein [Methylobacter sp.]MDI1278641.1 zonular occludens toxin domain-containing protein [Methylobacter sp.]MDI1359461.1 zonular occludens toxin domain-containing protein [Methylobacter sp.]
MIVFHEGLPRSGKSYEAALKQIIPALIKGRHVFAYIDGLNHEKFSAVSGLSLDRVTELLHQLTKEQVKDVHNHVQNDSLVLLDELQDFFPAGKTTLDPGITEFVTQHGHRGIDIVCMGQDHRDCHMLWKRRIDTLITFVKRDAVGRPTEYTWTTFKQQSGKFKQLRSGSGTYDPKYFGLYKSHLEGVTSIDAHQDDRINIFKSSVFTFWLPLFAAVLIVSCWYLWGFFHGNGMVNLPEPVLTQAAQSKPLPDTPKQQEKPPEKKEEPKKELPKAREYANFVERYLEEYRPRLAALVVASKGGKILAKIDFYTSDKRVYDSFNVKQLEDFGYTVKPVSFGLLLEKNGKQYPVTFWPLDIDGNTPDSIKPALGHPL